MFSIISNTVKLGGKYLPLLIKVVRPLITWLALIGCFCMWLPAVGTHPAVFSEFWHGANAKADDGDQHHDNREAGKRLPGQPRLGVFHHFSQHPGHSTGSFLSHRGLFLQLCSFPPPLLLFPLPLCLFLHTGDHAAPAAALHMARVHAPVVELIVQ